MAKITDEVFNESARQALKDSEIGLENGGKFSRQLCLDENLIRVYDGNGDYIYDFYLDDKIIKHKLTSEYAMDSDTEKLVKRILVKNRMNPFYKESKPMTDAQANALVRQMLNRGRPVPRLGYDAHTLHVGNKVSIFIDNNEIHIKEKPHDVSAWIYKMDIDTTKLALLAHQTAKEKYERKKKRRSVRQDFVYRNIGGIFACGLIAGMGVGAYLLVLVNKPAREAAARDKAIQAQVDEYAASLPNYDDSIRLARTNEELQNALNRREQARLKVIHYADSLHAMSK